MLQVMVNEISLQNWIDQQTNLSNEGKESGHAVLNSYV